MSKVFSWLEHHTLECDQGSLLEMSVYRINVPCACIHTHNACSDFTELLGGYRLKRFEKSSLSYLENEARGVIVGDFV